MKKCVWCGKGFEPKHGSNKYCKDKCREQAHAEQKRKYRIENKKQYNQYQKEYQKKRREQQKTKVDSAKAQNRAYTSTTNWQIAIMDFRGQSIKQMADIFNRSIESVQKQLKKLKRNGEYDVIIKRYIQQQPSEKKLYKGA